MANLSCESGCGSDENQLSWLVPLLSDRVIDIRWGALALSAALILDKNGEEVVVNEFQTLPGGVWAASIRVLLNDKECFVVRRQVLHYYINSLNNISAYKQGNK